MTRKLALPKLRMPRTRPAVRVRICAASSASPVACPCSATIASTGSLTSKRRGYGSTPSVFSSSRFARRCATWSDSATGASAFGVTRPASLCSLIPAASVRSFPWQRAAHRVEHAVDEADRIVRAERARELERLVDDHLRRRLGLVQELVDRHPENQAIEDVHPLDAPVLGRPCDDRVDVADAVRNAVRER